MTGLPKRELGRTGLQVTMLGYGAMGLRGAPRAHEITESQAETILNVVPRGQQPTRRMLRPPASL
jgi:aryl-alcohol dehydrogenase-like predicted oxidoreductase